MGFSIINLPFWGSPMTSWKPPFRIFSKNGDFPLGSVPFKMFRFPGDFPPPMFPSKPPCPGRLSRETPLGPRTSIRELQGGVVPPGAGNFRSSCGAQTGHLYSSSSLLMFAAFVADVCWFLLILLLIFLLIFGDVYDILCSIYSTKTIKDQTIQGWRGLWWNACGSQRFMIGEICWNYNITQTAHRRGKRSFRGSNFPLSNSVGIPAGLLLSSAGGDGTSQLLSASWPAFCPPCRSSAVHRNTCLPPGSWCTGRQPRLPSEFPLAPTDVVSEAFLWARTPCSFEVLFHVFEWLGFF